MRLRDLLITFVLVLVIALAYFVAQDARTPQTADYIKAHQGLLWAASKGVT